MSVSFEEMRTFFLLLCFLFSAFAMKAQPPSLSDSLAWAFSKPGTWVGKLQTRHSFITGKPVRTFGLKIGRSHADRVSYGIGLHIMDGGIESPIPAIDTISQSRKVRMLYASTYFEYSFFHFNKWRIILPIHLGMGASWHKTVNREGTSTINDRSLVMMYEPSMAFEYQVMKYMAVGAEIGYRLMLINNSNIPKQFTAPTWGLRLKISPGRIIDDLKQTN